MRCALPLCLYDLKATQVSIQLNLVVELRLYGFKLSHNTTEVIKNIYCEKGRGGIDYISVSKWLIKFRLGCKNLDDQAMPSRIKSVDSKAVLHVLDACLTSSCWRVPGNLIILQSTMVRHLHDLNKSTSTCWIVPHVMKILPNFWLSQVHFVKS